MADCECGSIYRATMKNNDRIVVQCGCGKIIRMELVAEEELPELKPCPFCGGEAYSNYKGELTNGAVIRYYYVNCGDCGASTEYNEDKPTQEEAFELWNTRTEDING